MKSTEILHELPHSETLDSTTPDCFSAALAEARSKTTLGDKPHTFVLFVGQNVVDATFHAELPTEDNPEGRSVNAKWANYYDPNFNASVDEGFVGHTFGMPVLLHESDLDYCAIRFGRSTELVERLLDELVNLQTPQEQAAGEALREELEEYTAESRNH